MGTVQVLVTPLPVPGLTAAARRRGWAVVVVVDPAVVDVDAAVLELLLPQERCWPRATRR